MKLFKKTGFFLTIAATIVAFFGCTSEEKLINEDEAPVVTNQPVSVVVNLKDTPDSRLAFYEKSPAMKSTWTAGDGFVINPTSDDESQAYVFNLTEGAGTSSGTFACTTTPPASQDYYVFYPSSLSTLDDYGSFSYEGQVQSGNGNTDHLGKYFSMRHYVHGYEDIRFTDKDYWTTEPDENGYIYQILGSNFEQSSCLKFIVRNLPKAIIPQSIEFSVRNGGDCYFWRENYWTWNETSISLGLENFTSTQEIDAYIMMAPQDLTIPTGATIRLTVTGENGECYYSDISITDNTTMERGKLHTATFSKDWVDKNYSSTDDTEDKDVTPLQTVNSGPSIDLVIMGDGFTDRLIKDGTYDKVMRQAYEDFFSIEPYISYKDYFNVYYIKAVSKNETYDWSEAETAFSCKFGGGTNISGDDIKVLDYTKTALGPDVSDFRLNNTLTIVMVNSERYAGTCWMYNGIEGTDYGTGSAIAYITLDATLSGRKGTLLHECGHGFAKLADEYFYEGTTISEEQQSLENMYANYGWYKNIDFTNDLTQVKWKDFINNSNFTSENIGAYEGGATYEKGVWRPTESSIMRYNTGEFNAPSREAIYYRINKLLNINNSSWEYKFADFVNWDQGRNKVTHGSAAAPSRAANEQFVPLAPPVIVHGYWKNGQFIHE